MKNTFGTSVSVTLFGESHGPMIGAVLDGMAPGIPVDGEQIAAQMKKRHSLASLSTPRTEEDEVRIVSGVYQGKTTGTPITFLIENRAALPDDYLHIRNVARPGHADYTAFTKYHGYSDPNGGGHFSGRLTAALVAAGTVALSALSRCAIRVGTHIASCAGIADRPFSQYEKDFAELEKKPFAALDDECAAKMQSAILSATADNDSVGGVLETAIVGLPAGVGEPWFDSLEGVLSHAIFSIPAVKGVEFGDGFALASMRGSEANDAFCLKKGAVATVTNRCGGILGGISDGMPIVFRTAIKPTPSIGKEQSTVDFVKLREGSLSLDGRFDPAIVHRAAVVADSVTALVLCDQLALRYGTDYLRGTSGEAMPL